MGLWLLTFLLVGGIAMPLVLLKAGYSLDTLTPAVLFYSQAVQTVTGLVSSDNWATEDDGFLRYIVNLFLPAGNHVRNMHSFRSSTRRVVSVRHQSQEGLQPKGRLVNLGAYIIHCSSTSCGGGRPGHQCAGLRCHEGSGDDRSDIAHAYQWRRHWHGFGGYISLGPSPRGSCFPGISDGVTDKSVRCGPARALARPSHYADTLS
eukprot:scaffold1929_cov376-Prasinococcus_capsulatus_cf.AAC.13